MANDLSPYALHVFEPDTRNNSWSNLFNFVPENSTVLDVGCSTGNFGAALIEEKGCLVTGVDLHAADVAEAKQRLTRALVMDINDKSAAETLGTFDVIIFADVLEHLIDPRATLRALRKLLADGGSIVYSIPNMAHLSTRLDLLAGEFPYTDTGLLDRTHLHFYDREEICNLFTEAGYEIIDEKPVVVEYPRTWIRDRLAQLGLSATAEFYDLLDHTESKVFQYVGIAIPAAKTGSPGRTRQRVMPNDEIIGYVAALLEHISHLEETLAAVEGRFAEVQRHPIADLQKRVVRRISRAFPRS